MGFVAHIVLVLCKVVKNGPKETVSDSRRISSEDHRIVWVVQGPSKVI